MVGLSIDKNGAGQRHHVCPCCTGKKIFITACRTVGCRAAGRFGRHSHISSLSSLIVIGLTIHSIVTEHWMMQATRRSIGGADKV